MRWGTTFASKHLLVKSGISCVHCHGCSIHCTVRSLLMAHRKTNLRQVALHMCISSKHTHMYTHATTRKLQYHQTYGTRCTRYCTKPNLTHICTHTLYKLHMGRSPQTCRTQFSNLCNTKSKEVCDIPSSHITQCFVCVC